MNICQCFIFRFVISLFGTITLIGIVGKTSSLQTNIVFYFSSCEKIVVLDIQDILQNELFVLTNHIKKIKRTLNPL